MAEQFMLRIDGIEGDSTVEGHEGAIDVVSWSWGVSHSGGRPGGGGGGSGRPVFDDLNVAARIGRASPLLVESCVTGRHHTSAVLTGLRDGGRELGEFLEYEFGDVTITSVEHGDSEDGPPAEEFSLAYRRFEIRHVVQRPDGSSGQTIGFVHDLS
jgi:type VI secretion system secreted protein Hcp